MQLFFLSCIAVACHVIFATDWEDCDFEKDNSNPGPYSPPTFFNITYENTVIYGLIPNGDKSFPLLGFMHGSTGEWNMYFENLNHLASHGFVVVFPHIKNPHDDKNPRTFNTDGKYLTKAIDWATRQNVLDDILFGKVDVNNIVYSGHSMGATCAIKGSHHQLLDDRIKLTVAQHPGICGPFGPPPSPATWTKKEFKELSLKHPVLLTTSTNDGAFWPVPYTALHEYGCWKNSMMDGKSVSVFIQFNKDECTDDTYTLASDGGHNCPLKTKNGGKPENPWVLVALKLYAQHGGSMNSMCHKLLWGDTDHSLSKSPWTDKIDFRKAAFFDKDANDSPI